MREVMTCIAVFIGVETESDHSNSGVPRSHKRFALSV